MNDPTPSSRDHALTLLRGNRLAEAKILCRRICQANPRDADSWNLLGAVHGMLGEFQEAEECCRKVIALQPDVVGTYNNLGNALKFQGKTEEAEECYRQALKLMPGYAEAHNNLGNLLKEQGELHEAEIHYRQAIASAPSYADAHSNLGLIRRDQDNLEDAIASYRRALQLDPNHRDALYNLGLALLEKDEFAAAAVVFAQLVRMNPQDSRALEILGTAYACLREFDKAIETYHRALEITPDLVDARYFLAALGNQAVPAQSPAEYVTKVFDTYAPRFDRHLLGNLDYQAPQLLRQAVATAIDGGRKKLEVLDLGCGTGLCGALFRDIAKHLTGVDLSAGMIQKARERGIYDELIVGDLSTPLRESNARYDLIIAADVFIYVGDLSQVFATCQIALQPGGLFAFSTECEGAWNRTRCAAPDAMRTQWITSGHLPAARASKRLASGRRS